VLTERYGADKWPRSSPSPPHDLGGGAQGCGTGCVPTISPYGDADRLAKLIPVVRAARQARRQMNRLPVHSQPLFLEFREKYENHRSGGGRAVDMARR